MVGGGAAAPAHGADAQAEYSAALHDLAEARRSYLRSGFASGASVRVHEAQARLETILARMRNDSAVVADRVEGEPSGPPEFGT